MKADDAVVVLLQDRNWRLTSGAGKVMADIQIEADVFPVFENRVRLVERGKVVRVVVEANPDFVFVGERCESFGLRVISLRGDAGAAKGPGDLEIEIDLLV